MPTLISIIVSIVASSLFLVLISRIRPKVEISPEISKDKSVYEKYIYVIKVLNKTKSPIMNIKAELRILTPRNKNFDKVFTSKKIKLIDSEIFILEKYDAEDKNYDYAYRFTTNEDLENLWKNNNSWLVFRLYAAHEITGFGKVFKKKYINKKHSIILGRFEVGDSFKIIKAENIN